MQQHPEPEMQSPSSVSGPNNQLQLYQQQQHHQQYTQGPVTSRTWINPDMARKRRLNAERQKICPTSPIFTQNFDYIAHGKAWQADLDRQAAAQEAYTEAHREMRAAYGMPWPPPRIRQAFDGKIFHTNQSTVLGLATIFCHAWRCGKSEVAPWPSAHEMQYEGPGRIASDRLHRRFLPLPRVPGNETVNWQQRSLVPQQEFDERFVHPGDEGIFFRTHWVQELQFTEEEARAVLGEELMGALGSEAQFV